ncbi:hypothetical protein [Rhodanobacter aciditrophus]|uniref:hypothetical protein n=1 Tax=Rhodanobacter aciditrophus TaxID=1623218 RepID=UPI003CFB7CFA
MKIVKGKNAIGYLVALVIVVCFSVAHQAYVTRAHPDAPFMDTLRLVYQLEQWLSGRMPFLEIWGKGGQHQGFINQLFLLANIKLFSMNVLLANRMTGIAIALLTAVLLFNFVSATKRTDINHSVASLVLQAAVSVLIATVCFGRAGWELFTLDLGLPLWTKNLSFVIYFSIHAWYLRAAPGRRVTRIASLGLTMAGPVVVLIIGMGWSYAFVAAVAAASAAAMIASFKQKSLREQIAKSIPLVTLLIAQLVYVVASMWGTPPNAKSSALIHVPDLVLYALGSSVIDQEAMQGYVISLHAPELIGACMLVAAAGLVLSRFWRSTSGTGSLLPIYLLAYGFFTAVSVSVARGHDGPAAVMASRYYMDIMLFCVGLIWLWYESLIRGEAKKSVFSMIGFLALCLVVGEGQRLDYKQEWIIAPYRAQVFKAMNDALRAGVPDLAAANLLQSPLDNARLGDQVLREHHFALFSNRPVSECEASGVQFMSGWYAQEAHGTWMGKDASMQVPDCGCDLVVGIYLPADFSARTLTILDGASRRQVNLVPGQHVQVSLGSSKVARAIDLSVSATTTPANMSNASSDTRSLGAYLASYAFACGTGATDLPAQR